MSAPFPFVPSSLRPFVAPSLASIALGLLLCTGCARIHNMFRETGPAVTADLDSPAAADVKARVEPAEQRNRDWELVTVAAESGAVVHGPLYLEDPFEDQGSGRAPLPGPDPQPAPESQSRNIYRWGWEDYVAMPYGLARFTMNWLLLPASLVVTPPWTEMESDGRLSRQLLNYDHDATPLKRAVPHAPPAAEGENRAAGEGEAAGD